MSAPVQPDARCVICGAIKYSTQMIYRADLHGFVCPDHDLTTQLRGYAAAVRTNAPASLIARYSDRLTAIGESYRKEPSMNPDFYDNAMAQWERQLTEPQLRLLAEVRAKGTVTKNGRIAKTALALVRAGLVDASWEPVAHASSMPTERWTITLR